MVRLAIQYRKRPVDLLQQESPHHLMGEGHARQRQQLAPAAELFGEAVGPADSENNLPHPAVALFADQRGQAG